MLNSTVMNCLCCSSRRDFIITLKQDNASVQSMKMNSVLDNGRFYIAGQAGVYGCGNGGLCPSDFLDVSLFKVIMLKFSV